MVLRLEGVRRPLDVEGARRLDVDAEGVRKPIVDVDVDGCWSSTCDDRDAGLGP